MIWRELFLFCSGIFFGGGVDHVILAVKGSETTPYGVRSGIKGNWALAGFDFGLAVTLYILCRRLTEKAV